MLTSKLLLQTAPYGASFLDSYSLIASNRVISGMNEESFPEDLLELFNLLEGICLKEMLIVPEWTGTISVLPDNELVSALSVQKGPIIQYPLPVEKLLNVWPKVHRRESFIGAVRSIQSMPEMFLDYRPQARGKYYFDRRTGDYHMTSEYRQHITDFHSLTTGILAEEMSDLPLLPSVRHASHYVESLGLDMTGRLFTEWERLYHKVEKGLKSAKVSRRGLFMEIYIPPIAYNILSVSRDVTEIVSRALDLRAALAPLRKEYAELWAAEADPDVSEKEYYKKRNNLATVAQSLMKKIVPERSAQNESQLSSAAADILDVVGEDKLSEVINGIHTEEVSIKGLLNLVTKYPLTWGWQKFRGRKLRTLFQIGKRFSSSRDYNRIVQRLWGRSLTPRERERAEVYATASKDLLKLQTPVGK